MKNNHYKTENAMKSFISLMISLVSFLFFSCPEPDEEIEYAYKREFSFLVTNNDTVEHKVTAVRLCQRYYSNRKEWHDLFDVVRDRKDAVAVVKTGETAIIDGFPLKSLEYVEPWNESFLLRIDDDFYLGSPRSDKYAEELYIDTSKIKKDNLHWVKITASTETPEIFGTIVPQKTIGIVPNKEYYDFSEEISVVIKSDDVDFFINSVEF